MSSRRGPWVQLPAGLFPPGGSADRGRFPGFCSFWAPPAVPGSRPLPRTAGLCFCLHVSSDSGPPASLPEGPVRTWPTEISRGSCLKVPDHICRAPSATQGQSHRFRDQDVDISGAASLSTMNPITQRLKGPLKATGMAWQCSWRS